ncbi:glycosyltransferase family 39 protein, partial [Frankia sp. CcWB2]
VSGRTGRIFTAVVGVLLAVSVIVRFTASQALWLDEAQSVAIARLPLRGSAFTMWDGLLQDGSPPLYYLVLHGWIKAFGEGTFAVRSLSALINIGAAWPLFLLARRVVGERAARVSVVLYLTSPFALYFGTETRMYSLIVLLTALGGLALERVLRAPSIRSAIALALCAGGLALTHYWCLYLLLTVGTWLVLLLVARPWWVKRQIRRGEGAGAADPAGVPGSAGVPGYRSAPGSPGSPASPASPASRGRGAPHSHRTPTRFLTPQRRGPVFGLLGIVGGGLVFAPWLPDFFDQLTHTGTPWGEPASYAAISHAYGQWAGGPTTLGRLLLFLVTGLAAAGIAGRPAGGRFILLDLRGLEPGRTLFLLATGTLVVAVTAGKVVGNAWADRYTATAFVPFLLVIGLGATIITDRRVFHGVVAVAALTGLLAGTSDIHRERSQATEAAQVLERIARPGDVMLVCPDQLGPGLARTVPNWMKVYVVPTYAPPDRVDWADYEQRNESADGVAIARRALAEAGPEHTVFLAGSGSYRTYEELCTVVRTTLQEARPLADEVMKQGLPARGYENYALLRFRAS